MDCIFCKIAEGSIKSNKLYENDKVIVFMDLNPVSNGHMLVIPKKHITDFTEMDNETLGSINETAKEMQKIIMKKLKPNGIKLVVNYGSVQVVKHYHLHLIPVYETKQAIKPLQEIYNILKAE